MTARLAGRIAVALLGNRPDSAGLSGGPALFRQRGHRAFVRSPGHGKPPPGGPEPLPFPGRAAGLRRFWAAFFLAGLMCTTPRASVMALSGLALGLCITTRASGALMAPIFLAAYLLGGAQVTPRAQPLAGGVAGRLFRGAASRPLPGLSRLSAQGGPGGGGAAIFHQPFLFAPPPAGA